MDPSASLAGADGLPAAPREADFEESVRDRFLGSMLGTFVGDALGMPLEGLNAVTIFHRHGRVHDLLGTRLGAGRFTDDTQMTAALAESLVACRGFDGAHAASCFVKRMERKRGYGSGTIEALERVAAGVPWQRSGAGIYGSGSFGNGAAMRVGPVGLLFHRDLDEVARIARIQSDITHCHPLGRGGAAVMAVSIALALRWGVGSETPLDPDRFLALVAASLEDKEGLLDEGIEKVRHVLRHAPRLKADSSATERLEATQRITAVLDTDSRAFNSVPTALYCFLATPGDPETSVINAVSLGGDTDTIAAMTGALAGAYRGAGQWPARWVDRLEAGPRGRDYVVGLADDLFLLWLELFSRDPLRPPHLVP